MAVGAVDARGRFRGTRAVDPGEPRLQGEACLTTGQPASSIGEPDRQRSRLARSPPGRAADLHCPLPCAVTTSMQLLFCVASAAIATSRSRLASGGAPPSDLRRARSRCARAGRVVHGCLPFLGFLIAPSPRSSTKRMVSLIARPSWLPASARRRINSSESRGLMRWLVLARGAREPDEK